MISETRTSGGYGGKARGGGPLFVTGIAHSGKTELGRLLADAPGIEVVRKAHFWTRHYGHYGDLGRPSNLARCSAALGRDGSVGKSAAEVLQIAEDLVDSGAPLSYGSLFAAIHGSHTTPVQVVQLRGLEHLAGSLLTDLPDARMVHLVRDPRSVLGLSRRAGRIGRRGWDLAAWARSAHLAIANRDRFPDRYWVLSWEQLTKDPTVVLRRLADLVGFEADTGTRYPDMSVHSKESPPPPRFVPVLEGLVADEMRGLGYSDTGAGSPSFLSGLVDRAVFWVRMRSGERR